MFIHVPKDKRTKLDPFGKKRIFVGYNDKSKAYRVYISSNFQINTIRYIIFDEVASFSK